ncbi:MBL fold metallo-hydrolase [Aureimonas fodinaquatilis]|uniref:MBL fold metallo-hydrolase n=1 Tax=Aureimonas fodinaquatilis TaxID=2565783 RepID=A0A5B0E1H9_9HYPH|nr:MBL fold metallo-hydrolase [Aureimonas fodinaquatilis]KAA0972506.1 MBL fold metallo-hydrolase [Aureimonas fodinaquatilis]
MKDTLALQTQFDPQTGKAVEVAPMVWRITAANASPMTFHGTNSYLIGRDSLVVVDPGPDDPKHMEALMAAIGSRPVEAILITHTHLDHTVLTAQLAAETGAPVMAQGPHKAARPLFDGEVNLLDAAADHALVIDRRLDDGEVLKFRAGTFQAVATPGHCANHMVFALPDQTILLSGDHVMAWSTSIVAPPDGSMADYMASLDKLMKRREATYFPGHGGPVENPQAFLRGLRSHRRMRETAILERLNGGDSLIADIVAAIYRTTDKRLHGAAGLSVLAQLEYLHQQGRVQADGPPSLTTRWALA